MYYTCSFLLLLSYLYIYNTLKHYMAFLNMSDDDQSQGAKYTPQVINNWESLPNAKTQLLRGIYALILSLSVIITLFILNTKITLLSVFIFGSFYYFVISVFRKEIKLNRYLIIINFQRLCFLIF